MLQRHSGANKAPTTFKGHYVIDLIRYSLLVFFYLPLRKQQQTTNKPNTQKHTVNSSICYVGVHVYILFFVVRRLGSPVV